MSDVAAGDRPDATTEACPDVLRVWPPWADLDESVRGKSVVREPARSAPWEFRDAAVPAVAASPDGAHLVLPPDRDAAALPDVLPAGPPADAAATSASRAPRDHRVEALPDAHAAAVAESLADAVAAHRAPATRGTAGAARKAPGPAAAKWAAAWPKARRGGPAQTRRRAASVRQAARAALAVWVARLIPAAQALRAWDAARVAPAWRAGPRAWPEHALPPADGSAAPPVVGGSARSAAATHPPRASPLSRRARFRRQAAVPEPEAPALPARRP
jgi:hypothetical protein